MKRYISAVAIFVVLSLCVPALAHHSIPVFWNQEKKIEITGILKSATIVNPHSVFVIEVTEPNGQKSDWTGITAAGTAMLKAGWTTDTIKAGTKVFDRPVFAASVHALENEQQAAPMFGIEHFL